MTHASPTRRSSDLRADGLGTFLQSLHAVDTADVPAEPEHWCYRCGVPVTETIDRWADRAAAELADLFNPASVREAWQRLRDVPVARGADRTEERRVGKGECPYG